MIKKIRITNHNERAVRDTTIGKVYDATFHKKGTEDAWGALSIEDSLCFRDDVGDRVSIWTCYDVYEVVEEEPTSETKEDDWNTVNWDEIPEDVEAVVTFNFIQHLYYKHIDGVLYVQGSRSNEYSQSGYIGLEEVRIDAGDEFHLRPSPTTQPTPEPPELTQVESSEVEAATTPEFDWSSVDSDVEAVFLHGKGDNQWQQWYKTVDGYVMVGYPPEIIYTESFYTTLLERINDADAVGKCYIRPPATTPPSEKVTCKVEFYEGELPEGMISLDEPTKPSIYLILQEAQQSILKHHGVTGKVKFTVTCSE